MLTRLLWALEFTSSCASVFLPTCSSFPECAVLKNIRESFSSLYQFQETLLRLLEGSLSVSQAALSFTPSCSFVEKLHKLGCDASQEREPHCPDLSSIIEVERDTLSNPSPVENGVIKTRPEINEIEKSGRKLIKPKGNEIDEPLTRLTE